MRTVAREITDLTGIDQNNILTFETFSFVNFEKHRTVADHSITVYLQLNGRIQEIEVSSPDIHKASLRMVYDHLFNRYISNYDAEIKEIVNLFGKYSHHSISSVYNAYTAQNYLERRLEQQVIPIEQLEFPLDVIPCINNMNRLMRMHSDRARRVFIFTYKWTVFEVRF